MNILDLVTDVIPLITGVVAALYSMTVIIKRKNENCKSLWLLFASATVVSLVCIAALLNQFGYLN